LAPVSDDHIVPIDAAPGFTLTKTSSSLPTAANETLEYTFTAVNIGNVSISDVAIVDAKCAAPAVLDAELGGSVDLVLEVGETVRRRFGRVRRFRSRR